MVATSGSWGRLAPSLVAMVNEADRTAPNRSKLSDGSLGDQSHRTRSSFHNPSGGYVDALDLTHDPGDGFDAHARARQVAARGDSRIDHIISNRQIWAATSRLPWRRGSWRRYTGPNPHTQHAHFAVKRNNTGRTSTGSWWGGTKPGPRPRPPTPVPKPKGFLMALTDAEEREVLANSRKVNEVLANSRKDVATIAIIRREGSVDMDTVSLQLGLERRKLPTQHLADVFKFILDQPQSLELPKDWFDWLKEIV